MVNFYALIEELKEISPYAFCISGPRYYWSVDEDGINCIAVKSNALVIPLSLSTEEKQQWCDKLNACTKEMRWKILSTGKMKTLPFVLYSGVPELDGYGYFPLCQNQPCPAEMAEVLGYAIAEEKQEVIPCTQWGVVFSYGNYHVVPHFPEDAALGWDGESVIIINQRVESKDMLYSCGDKQEAEKIALLLNKAYKKGCAHAVGKMKGLLDNL